jgi:hypothetical protein
MNRELTISELEARMRPGAWSGAGFLGATESLKDVIILDTQVLSDLNISHEQVANTLESVLLAAKELEENSENRWARMMDYNILLDVIFKSSPTPYFHLDNLPDADKGYLVKHFQVLTVRAKGFQECPWGCEDNPTWGSFDFVIVNRETGEYITGPGLIVHLIREHHFFEGVESSYRVYPAKVVRVLEL